MSSPMNLRVCFCHPIGLCSGIRRGFLLLKLALILARLTGRQVYYRDPPHEAMGMIRATLEKGVPVIEWFEGLKKGLRYITPYGAKADAFKVPHIDGSCPVVKRIRRRAIWLHRHGYKIVFASDKCSSEVEAIQTFIGNSGIVILNQREAYYEVHLLPGEKVAVLAQSSYRPDQYDAVVKTLRVKYPQNRIVADRILCHELEERTCDHVKSCCLRHQDALVVLGSFESKQVSYMAMEMLHYSPRLIRAEGPEDLGSEQFRPGNRVMVISGNQVTDSRLQAVHERLLNLTTDDHAVPRELPDPCRDCSEVDHCQRHECLECLSGCAEHEPSAI